MCYAVYLILYIALSQILKTMRMCKMDASDISRKADTFMRDIEQAINTILKTYHVHVQLSTMTVMIHMHCHKDDKIDLDVLRSRFDDEDIQTFLRDVFGDAHAVTLKRKGKHFNNSLLFSIPNHQEDTPKKRQQSVKVFCNGNLHITGYKTLHKALEMADVFATMFELVLGGNGVEEWFRVHEYDVQLINFYYKLGIMDAHILDLKRMHAILTKHFDFYCSYNNDHYSGVIVKAPSFSVLIFESGNIIFTSIRCAQELMEAFREVHVFLDAHASDVSVPSSSCESRERKKKNKEMSGFDYGKYLVLK